jgi:hypothetical protein
MTTLVQGARSVSVEARKESHGGSTFRPFAAEGDGNRRQKRQKSRGSPERDSRREDSKTSRCQPSRDHIEAEAKAQESHVQEEASDPFN